MSCERLSEPIEDLSRQDGGEEHHRKDAEALVEENGKDGGGDGEAHSGGEEVEGMGHTGDEGKANADGLEFFLLGAGGDEG